MSIVKSFAIGNGDMYYIRHGSDNFTIIDCNLPDDRRGSVLAEIATQSRDKGITRFISTHPDQDHISGLVDLDNEIGIPNFYCVRNQATKTAPTSDFRRYCQLRDDPGKAFYVFKGCTRRWMNRSGDGRGESGIEILWPDVDDSDYKSALADAAAGLPPNNISCVVQYSLQNGVTMLWMGDLETDFMEKLEAKIDIPKVVFYLPRTMDEIPEKFLVPG